MRRASSLSPIAAATALVLMAGALLGCGPTNPVAAPRGRCPSEPVAVVVTVAQWSDLVERLGGDCVRVTTIVGASVADPHDFEPTPVDLAKLSDARLVVMNGLGYDEWARHALDAVDPRPTVVDIGTVAGRRTGDNPHVWYSPTVVHEASDVVSEALARLVPGARTYLDGRRDDWRRELAPYDAEIARIRAGAGGRSYAATESVFDEMAVALGLRDVTPEGYRRAVSNGSDPSPVDVSEVLDALSQHGADVLVVNTQTEGPLTGRLRRAAEAAGVPVVGVTETVPKPRTSFVEWQLHQLRRVASALGT